MAGTQLAIRSGFLSTSPVPEVVIDAVRDLKVTQRAGQRGGFQMTLALEKGGAIERELLPDGFFAPPTRMILSLITDGVREVLMDGHIAKYDVQQSNAPGQATLTITGTDATQLMDQIDLTGIPFAGVPPIGQVALILSKYAMLGIVPLVLPTPLIAVDNPLKKWKSQKGTDYAHIRWLAGQVGYQFSLEPGPSEGMQIAYFGPDLGSTGGRIAGAGQEALPPLTVNMDAASNVESLSIGFDGMSKPLVYGFYQNPDAPVPVIPIPFPDQVLNPPLGPGFIPYAKNLALNKPGGDAGGENDDDRDGMSNSDLASLIMKGMARAAKGANVITASGSLDVARYGRVLRPRRLVDVRGAGPHSNGTFYIQTVATSIQRGKFTQSFTLSKNAHGSFSEKVAV